MFLDVVNDNHPGYDAIACSNVPTFQPTFSDAILAVAIVTWFAVTAVSVSVIFAVGESRALVLVAGARLVIIRKHCKKTLRYINMKH